MASTSRMWARNRLPRPSPLLAPSTRPPMSTNCTAAGTTFLESLISASASGGRRAPWPRPRWGRWWRRRTARRGRRRRRGRCRATTCRRWAGRRTRSVSIRGRDQGSGSAGSRRPVPTSVASAVTDHDGTDDTATGRRSTASSYLLDRDRWPRRQQGRGPSATRPHDRARARTTPSWSRRAAPARSPTWTASGPPPAPSSPTPSTRAPSAYLARARGAETVIDPRRGRGRCEAAARATATATRLVRRRRADRRRWPGPRSALGHEYLVMTDHSPRLTVAHGLDRERLSPAARRDRRAQRASWPRSGSSPGSRSTSSRTARLDQDEDLLARLDVVVASVHSKLRMDRAGDDPAHGAGGGQPPRRHPRPLHRPQGHRSGAPAVPTSTPRSSSPPAPASTPPSRSTAAPSARTRPRSCSTWPSSGAARSRSTPTPTPRASSSGRPTAATRPPATGSTRRDRQHLGRRRPAVLDRQPPHRLTGGHGLHRARPGRQPGRIGGRRGASGRVVLLCRSAPRRRRTTRVARRPTTGASPTRAATPDLGVPGVT